MATTYLAPIGNDANFTVAGLPASGYKLFTYIAGTTTKQVTYQGNTDATTQNANPILLSSQGYPASGGAVVEIWQAAGVAMKYVLAPSTDTDPPSNPVWTRDNVIGINDPTGVQQVTQSEWIAYSSAPTFISSTSFSVTGDQRSIFAVNRRVQTTNTGGTVYSTITAASFGSGITTVTVFNDSGSLDSGLSAVSYALLNGTNISVPSRALIFPSACEGRLTLVTATPVTTTDQTAKTAVFFTPYKGNRIATYSGSGWVEFAFTEQTVAVPSTTSTPFDIFIVHQTLALETVNWTSDTARATSLDVQDGVLVKNGDHTRRYLGTGRTTGSSGQIEDSLAKRYLWNYYNRVSRKMLVQESTASWTYSTATYRQANGAAGNQLDMVIGVSEDTVKASVAASATSSNAATVQLQVGIGIDSTTTNSADLFPPAEALVTGTASSLSAVWSGYPGIGRHFLAWLEISGAFATSTWYGTGGLGISAHSGIIGEIMA